MCRGTSAHIDNAGGERGHLLDELQRVVQMWRVPAHLSRTLRPVDTLPMFSRRHGETLAKQPPAPWAGRTRQMRPRWFLADRNRAEAECATRLRPFARTATVRCRK